MLDYFTLKMMRLCRLLAPRHFTHVSTARFDIIDYATRLSFDDGLYTEQPFVFRPP